MQKSKWVYTQASIAMTCKSVSKRSHTFLPVIAQIRTSSLNLGSSIKGTLMQIWKSPYMFAFKQK